MYTHYFFLCMAGLALSRDDGGVGGSANCEPMLPNCCLFFPLHEAAPSAWNDGPCPPTRPTLLIIILKNIYLYNCLVFDSSVVCVSVFTYPSFSFFFFVSRFLQHPHSRCSTLLFLFYYYYFLSLGNPDTFTHLSPFSSTHRRGWAGQEAWGRLVLFDVRCVSAIFLA